MTERDYSKSSDVLYEVLDVWDQYGWYQGDFGNKVDGFCVMGAIRFVTQTHFPYNPHIRGGVRDRTYSYLDSVLITAGESETGNDIALTNDNPFTTESMMRSYVKDAIILAEQEGN